MLLLQVPELDLGRILRTRLDDDILMSEGELGRLPTKRDIVDHLQDVPLKKFKTGTYDTILLRNISDSIEPVMEKVHRVFPQPHFAVSHGITSRDYTTIGVEWTARQFQAYI